MGSTYDAMVTTDLIAETRRMPNGPRRKFAQLIALRRLGETRADLRTFGCDTLADLIDARVDDVIDRSIA